MAKGTMHSIKDFLNSIFGDTDFKYAKELAFACVIIALCVGGYYGYRWYNKNQEQAAHQLFARNVEEFEREVEEGKAEGWQNVETLFQLGYDQHSKSSLAPYFLIYKAEAMIRQNKDATKVLEDALNQMPNNSPIKSLYGTKLALMLLDTKTDTQEAEDARNKGIDMLKNIAADTSSTGNDVASYYLGLYYWNNNDMNQAKEVWGKLIDTQKDVQKLGQSPWALLAQEKLGQIV